MSTSSEARMFAPTAAVPLCTPEIRGNEWLYVKECLDTGWVSSAGAYVERFESCLAERVGSAHAVATVNGTSALHTALLIAGVGPDDEVLISTLTFIAPANAIRYCGAWPVFVDAEPNYWQMDSERLRTFLENDCHRVGGELRNRATGRRVKAIVPVHILGHPVDLAPILELAERFGLTVIEDATEGLGALYRGGSVGSFGAMGCFSFNGNKMLTTGGGGMLVTNDPALAERARYLTTQAKDDAIEYIHGEVGYNYRLTNVQAAIGCAQLEQLDAFVAAKRQIAARYARELTGLPGVTVMPEAPWAQSAWWLYTILIDEADSATDRRQVMAQLGAVGIQTRPLWQPLHLSPVFRGAQVLGGTVAERLNRQALSLPCSVGLSGEAQGRVIEAITGCCRGC